ncbi:cysteine desulfurase [Peptoniphilus asaccharolyticus DSM 20463]|uniref:Cysteine desulfurase n=1 Tax=Peptoniphilus asaccharolyticus DSM 20463 TaxID=573058 RepID=A0A1W1UL43_PEPAS|nr:cysteine desulfurase family protein [Peptoniphilus asaccharolyticus]MBL7574857.1 cysteine desulfurase [Peptoniphilus asaccharolyticus]SMB81743.1 cysteine desulfurase [Peptoniphilus asaccharolyticus DSM 20463]
MIYLDNCATTKPREEVVEVMVRALTQDYANPSSLHSFGLKMEKEVNVARKKVADAFGADESEIYFTSGGTESSNIAIQGFIKKNIKRHKKVITTKLEHSSVLFQFRKMKELGIEVVEVGVDTNGVVDEKELLAAIDEDTFLVSLFHVNNEIGSINPVKDLISKIKKINREIMVHVDGVQAVGKLEVNLHDIGCDSYSISAHKIYGPKGIGALYLKNGVKIDPLVIGGGQENGMRSGTENVPGILGFGVAAEMVVKNFKSEQESIKACRDRLLERLQEIDDVKINSTDKGVNNILSISVLNTRGEVLLHSLERDNIYISVASACTSNGTGKSHVLDAIKLEQKYVEGTVRICFSKDNTVEEIDEFFDKFKEYVEELREIMVR